MNFRQNDSKVTYNLLKHFTKCHILNDFINKTTLFLLYFLQIVIPLQRSNNIVYFYVFLPMSGNSINHFKVKRYEKD